MICGCGSRDDPFNISNFTLSHDCFQPIIISYFHFCLIKRLLSTNNLIFIFQLSHDCFQPIIISYFYVLGVTWLLSTNTRFLFSISLGHLIAFNQSLYLIFMFSGSHDCFQPIIVSYFQFHLVTWLLSTNHRFLFSISLGHKIAFNQSPILIFTSRLSSRAAWNKKSCHVKFPKMSLRKRCRNLDITSWKASL